MRLNDFKRPSGRAVDFLQPGLRLRGQPVRQMRVHDARKAGHEPCPSDQNVHDRIIAGPNHSDSESSPGDPVTTLELARVGATVKQMREMRGMTQDQLANAALISRAYLANIEAGRKKPSGKAIARIAGALHVPQISIIAPTTEEVPA